MANFRKIILLLCLLTFAATISSSTSMFLDKPTYAKSQEETMTILITINSGSYTKMQDIPTTGFLEVYTILGERIKRLNLKDCKDGVSLELKAGLYIIRAGKVGRKIIVR